jgi:1-acyl-sn-glycerol-3-phosphate acyltransferase
MWLEPIRNRLFELWLILDMIYHTKVRFKLARLRRAGREAEAEAIVRTMISGWSHWVLDSVSCKVEVQGREHVPQGRPFVIYCNHQSKFDIPVLVTGLGQILGFVTKKELFAVPGLAFWMRQINCVSIDRQDVVGGAEVLARLGAEIKRRNSGFIIFPEGTRTRDPQRRVQPFRRGALRLAATQDLPVLPVTVDGTHLLDDSRAMARTRGGGRVVRVRVEPLRTLPGTSGPQRKRFMDELYETVRSNREAIRVEWPGSTA